MSSGPKILLKCPISPWYLKIASIYLCRNVFIHWESSKIFPTTCPYFVYYSKNIFKLSKNIFIYIILISLIKLFIIPSAVIQSPSFSWKCCHVYFFWYFFLEEFSFVRHFTNVMFCHLSWQFLSLFFFLQISYLPFTFPFLISLISLCLYVHILLFL